MAVEVVNSLDTVEAIRVHPQDWAKRQQVYENQCGFEEDVEYVARWGCGDSLLSEIHKTSWKTRAKVEETLVSISRRCACI